LALTSLFFFTTPPTPLLYTLSLHDALPISHRRIGGDIELRPVPRAPERATRPRRGHQHRRKRHGRPAAKTAARRPGRRAGRAVEDRKSTRLNSSHVSISYAVFCLKKKNKNK